MPDRRRELPAVEALLNHPLLAATDAPRVLKRRAAREVLAAARAALAGAAPAGSAPASSAAADTGDLTATLAELATRAAAAAHALARPHLRPVVNATGVVVHTNLGRSVLSAAAQEAVARAAAQYSTLEFDLERGERGSRQAAVRDLLIELTGAEDALVVNNNAAAVLLTLSGLAHGREVIVSRGELVEIGGSFRLPDIMARSGARLREVGTTNKTHLADYARAIGPETALILKVHRSNFAMAGFVAEVALPDLVALGRAHGIPVAEDLGSGALLDLGARVGSEPTAAMSLAAGAGVVMFSGDKLLGGPQAGVLVGEVALLRRLASDPLARALRLDKLSLAALEATLRAYLEPGRAWAEIPTLRLLARPVEELAAAAAALAAEIAREAPDLEVCVAAMTSRVGGGALPTVALPSAGIALRPRSGAVAALEAELRGGEPPILGRIEEGQLLLDLRTLLPGDRERIMAALRARAQDRSRLGRS
jgi:L-seryl-tRNA(Ser) seleniumtransferase